MLKISEDSGLTTINNYIQLDTNLLLFGDNGGALRPPHRAITSLRGGGRQSLSCPASWLLAWAEQSIHTSTPGNIVRSRFVERGPCEHFHFYTP
eukprot:scaffold266415_cov32-Tisochrysis_lutea.AAC.1